MVRPKTLWKTTIVIWSQFNPELKLPGTLVEKAESGLAYMSRCHSIRIANPCNRDDGPPERRMTMKEVPTETETPLTKHKTNAEGTLARQHLSRMAEVFLTEDSPEVVVAAISGSIQNGDLRREMARVVRDYCAQNLRPEVKKFAGLMEMKLLKHDPAWGQCWKTGDADHHVVRIIAITEELCTAVKEGKRVGIKAADLANHAMMLADQAGELEDL